MKTRMMMLFPWLACAAAGCAAGPSDVSTTDDENGAATAVVPEASRSLCPGRPPPPRECSTVICLGGDASWEYEPLDAGTPCDASAGPGLCDGQGFCIAIPPVHQTLAVDGSLFSAGAAAVLSGTTFAIDTTGNGVPLITGHHTECNEGPGGIGLICRDIADSHQTYLAFSDALKSQFGASDFVFDVSTFCNWFTCVNVNQIHGDLGATQIEFDQSSGGVLVKATIPVQTGHPTFIIDLAPDVDLTDVQFSLRGEILPNAAGTGVAFVSAIEGDLDFHLDTSIPDWLVDIDGDIKSAVHDNVTSAFMDQSRRNALDGVLNAALTQYAQLTVPGFTGFKQITFVSASGNTLFVDYIPN